ncbi:MAG: type II secretion system protein GspF [Gammaproteobacteria bacterium]|nr:type II secretion system protein GspF [Gammaproteobacteria bacterium]
MTAFSYIALGANGRKTSGLLEADSARHARRQLRERALLPLSVTPTAEKGTVAKPARRSRARLKPTTVVLFTRLLGALLEAGLPLDGALSAIARQSSDPALRLVVIDVRSRVLEGQSLAAAVGQFPRSFPEVYCATVGAGEQTRLLPLVVQRIADYLERRQLVTQKIQLALIYPAVLSLVSVLVVGGLLTFVVPEMVKVFAHSAHALPTITLALLAVSSFTARYWPALGGLAVALGWGWQQALRQPRARYLLHAVSLRLPGLAGFTRANDGGRFARTLGILLNSGLTMLDALFIAEKSVVNLVLRAERAAAAARVREGAALANALANCPHLPPLLVHLVASGESVGELPRMLETAALASEREVELRVAVGLNLLEPVLILTMGLVVLGIVLAILLPIFEMNRLV